MLSSKYIKLCIFVFVAELVLLAAFSSPSYILKVMATEGVNVEDALGSDALQRIDADASTLFNALFIDSGVYSGIWHTFIPTPDERNASEGIELMASGLFAWVDDRLTACMILLFQVIERLELMLMWLPFSFVLTFGACYTGLTLRHIKQGNFAFASPTVHRVSLRVILVMLTLLPIFLMLPFPISPYIYPVLYTAVAFMLQAILANIAKRL